jgi:Bacterial mobilisation protein (MobC)
MPRKRKSATGEIRDKAIRVHLSATELLYLQERAGALSLSEYLLKAGLGQSIPQRRQPQPVPQLNREMLLELGKIGGNLNQIAKTCHLSLQRGSGCTVDLKLLVELQAAIQTLSQRICGIDLTEEDEP